MEIFIVIIVALFCLGVGYLAGTLKTADEALAQPAELTTPKVVTKTSIKKIPVKSVAKKATSVKKTTKKSTKK